ncbi:MAG: hypothetical protein QXS57_02390 [Candidatus Caldarchaeum sp.]
MKSTVSAGLDVVRQPPVSSVAGVILAHNSHAYHNRFRRKDQRVQQD